MATAKLYLRDPNSTKPTPIILMFSFDGKRTKLPTEQKIPPTKWNPKTQKVRQSFTGSPEINANLDTRVALVKKIYNQAKVNDIAPSAQYIKDKFKKHLVLNRYMTFLTSLIISSKPQHIKV